MGAAVWAYDAGAMGWRRAVGLELPGDDGQERMPTARACAWAPALGRADEMVAVALGSGDVALYRLPLWGVVGVGGAEDGGGAGKGGPCPSRVRPAQTLRHRSGGKGGAPLAAWRVEFNATGTALACSVEEAQGGGGGAGRGGGSGGQGGGGQGGDQVVARPPAQVWFWMPNLESGVWRAVASVEGGEEEDDDEDDVDGGDDHAQVIDGGVRMLA
jgi:hypothetical protein